MKYETQQLRYWFSYIFLSFAAKNGYAVTDPLYDKCERKYIVLYTM